MSLNEEQCAALERRLVNAIVKADQVRYDLGQDESQGMFMDGFANGLNHALRYLQEAGE